MIFTVRRHTNSHASSSSTGSQHHSHILLILQKVIRHASRDQRLAGTRSWVKLQKGILEVLVDFHDGCLVAASVAVVGCRKDGNNVTLLRPVESVHDQLMCSCHQCQAIVVVERFRNVLAKRVARTSWRDAPSTSVIWVRPQQVTHRTFVRHFLDTVDGSNVVQSVDRR